MGGYGLYVWGSFGMSALLMVAEPLLLQRQRREIITTLLRMARQKRGEARTMDEGVIE
ncbi:MAG: heme exporter protein CcmD [Gammaproteobacteria bacterium]|nr:heme exporter protein CcmD [Gammaproteobacteria bacterium]